MPANKSFKNWTLVLCVSAVMISLLFVDWRNKTTGISVPGSVDDSAIRTALRNIPVRDSAAEIWGKVIGEISKFRDTSVTPTMKNRGEDDIRQATLFVFNRPVSFSSDTFRTTMSGLYFRSDAGFLYSRFDKGLTARQAESMTMKSYNSILLYQSIFNGRCDFLNNNFKSPFELLYCTFRKPVNFLTRDTLSTKVSFEGNFFGAGLHFNNLDKFANLKRVAQERLQRNKTIGFQQIGSTVTIKDCEFHGKLDFSACEIMADGKLEFENNILPDTLDLSKFRAASLDLRGFRADTGAARICYLNLLDSRIANLNVEYHNYRLYFPPGTTDDQVSSTYQSLLKSVKDNGYNSSYEELDMEYRHVNATRHPLDSNSAAFTFVRKHISKTFAFNAWVIAEKMRPAHLWDTIQRTWWGYGYEKTKVLYWSLLIIFGFSIYNFYHYGQLLSVLNIENLNPSNIPENTSGNKRKALTYWYCLTYTSFLFFKISFEFKALNFGKRFVLILLVQYFVGLICSAFIVNLIFSR